MKIDGSIDVAEILFAMIRYEICGTELDDNIKRSISQDVLKELYQMAKAHDVEHIVSSALSKNGLLGKDQISDAFNKSLMMSIYRLENMEHVIGEVCGVFEEVGIPHILLKGSVIRHLYPEAWMRTSCDVDILVQEEDLERSVNAIVERLGYKADKNTNYHDISLYSQSGIHIELHFSIKENMDNIDRLLSKVWDYSYQESSGGFRYQQTAEYFVFHHIAHMVYHFVNGGCGVKPFVDLCVLKSKMKYDEQTVRSYLKECGVEEFYDNVLRLTDVWFDGGEHTPTSLKIEDYIIKGGVYGSLENKIAVAQIKRGGKARYVLSRLFVSYDVLRNYYSILNKHRWLTPLMQVRRWIDSVGRGGIKRGAREISAGQKTSQDEVLDIKNFLNEIGL